MSAILWIIGALALFPAVNTFLNAWLLGTPALPAGDSRIAILIPARDEAANIGDCVDAALASVGADVEVIVLDDGSTDRTRAIVETRAARDARARVVAAPPLPSGWMGKPHACHVLANLTDRPFLLFIDADVRLAPTGAARLVPPDGVDLVSAVPRQIVKGWVEASVIPMINSLILGYLPVAAMRRLGHPALAAACGQLLMARAAAYRRCGGHGAIAGRIHDAMQLARLFRREGLRTDLVDGAALAHCRMYDSPGAVIEGFAKNATEGMARPVALPVWTVLLAGGHLLPPLALAASLAEGGVDMAANAFTATAFALLVFARALQAVKCREPARCVALHPVGVALTLAIQGLAFYRRLRGTRVRWRGRTYALEN
jgi:hypothetical protein